MIYLDYHYNSLTLRGGNMTKEEFNLLSQNDQLEYVNVRLREGISFTQVTEKEIGIRRNTVRDRFKRMGYVLDQEVMQFVLVEPTKEIKQPIEPTTTQKKLKESTKKETIEQQIKKLESRMSLLEELLKTPLNEKSQKQKELKISIESSGSYRNYKLNSSIIEDLEKLALKYPHLTTANIVNSLLREALDNHLNIKKDIQK